MKKYLLAYIAILLVLSGCSSQGSNGKEAAGASNPDSALTLIDSANRELSFPAIPEKIVALSSGDVDIIYDLGGELVGRPTSDVAVPKAAEAVEQVGTSHELDLEKIALLRPDVVLGNRTLNAKDTETIEGIGSQMLLTEANSIDDIEKQIKLLGELLQKGDKAEELIQIIHKKKDDMEKQHHAEMPKVLIIYGAPGTYMAALDNSLGGDILKVAGGTNIASDFPKLENYPQYAQLNSERIVEANPEYVLLMTHGDAEDVKAGFVKEMEQNPAWNSIEAVVNNHVEVLPSDLFGTNPGTRVIEAIDLLHGMLQNAE